MSCELFTGPHNTIQFSIEMLVLGISVDFGLAFDVFVEALQVCGI